MGRQTNNKNKQPTFHLPLAAFEPASDGQEQMERDFDTHDVLTCRGMPGTGKTFWAMYLALREIFSRNSPYRKLIILRSAVPLRKSGFLPGTHDEKSAPYSAPYVKHCTKLFGRGDAYEILRKASIIEFESTDFLRGIEWNETIVIVDEPQNMADNELHTINTRFGDNCKLIFCGDTGQDDLTSVRYKEESGYDHMNRIHDKMPNCSVIKFGIDDIVRSGYIKEYLIAREKTQHVKQLLS